MVIERQAQNTSKNCITKTENKSLLLDTEKRQYMTV